MRRGKKAAWHGPVAALLVAALTLGAPPALALLPQTGSDLAQLEDALKEAVAEDPGLAARALPMLVATPRHHWRESRQDFAALALKTLRAVFKGPNDLIQCPDCDAWRVDVKSGRLFINNGELSLAELGRLRQDPRYGKARSLAMLAETPAGVSLRLIDLADGRLLFDDLADSSASLDDQHPFLHYQAERERRQRGEALAYVFLDLGLYPNGLVQAEFLEQWGARNQHLSGLSLSLINPDFALGATYHYAVPRLPKLQAAAGVFMPLQNAFQSQAAGQNATSKFVAQASVQYVIASSFAVLAAVSTEGKVSLGFACYNPLFMPFLL